LGKIRSVSEAVHRLDAPNFQIMKTTSGNPPREAGFPRAGTALYRPVRLRYRGDL
jgi:hypothetical protein